MPQSPVWGLPGYPVETTLSNKMGNDPPTHTPQPFISPKHLPVFVVYTWGKRKLFLTKRQPSPRFQTGKALPLFLMGGVGEGLWEQRWAYLCSLSPSFQGRERWLHLTSNLGEKQGIRGPAFRPWECSLSLPFKLRVTQCRPQFCLGLDGRVCSLRSSSKRKLLVHRHKPHSPTSSLSVIK